jgi:type II secretory pathway pseudopilin PulG
MSSRHAGFTLLEICLALAIGVMIIVLAVPSIAGVIAEQRLKQSFERFDRLVSAAKLRSVTGQRAHVLVWDREGVSLLVSDDAAEEPADTTEERMTFEKEESLTIRRPAALMKDAPGEWVFWRNGTCEPAVISYQGPAGSWVVNYDALTGRGTFVSSEVP